MAKVTITIVDEGEGSKTRMEFEPKTPELPEDFTMSQKLAMGIVSYLKHVSSGEMTTGIERDGKYITSTEKFGDDPELELVGKRFPAQFNKSVN